jgi:hypothetical protein
MYLIDLSVLNCQIRIECADKHVEYLILTNYGSLRSINKAPDLDYRISRDQASHRFVISREGLEPRVAVNDGEFLFLLEKDITIELQKLRRDLYFLHSAALEFSAGSFLLVAASGVGKSTTTWGLLHRGFRYLSDELAPVQLEYIRVHPYPHAVCLKKEPPKPYFLPYQTLYTTRTIHVPTQRLPSDLCSTPLPLKAIFFLHRSRPSSEPAIQPVGKAEAAARLFASALNPLTHLGEGLDAAIEIVRRSVCFALAISDLSKTCALIENTLSSFD